MVPKVIEKAYAVALRKKGLSYNEILRKVPVTKSTLSLWLRDTALSEDEKRMLKDRRAQSTNRGILKAAASHRANRENRDKILFEEMRSLYEKSRHESLFLIGISLYWAEGTKRANFFAFVNSDFEMTRMMLDWIERYFSIPREFVGARLYLHKPFAHESHEERWAKEIGIPRNRFKTTIFKPTGKLVKKRPDYRGCLRLEITSGLAIRKMQFLIRIFLDDYAKGSKVINVLRP